MTTPAPHDTLGTADYCSDEIFELERRQIFHRGWCYVGHRASFPTGSKRVIELAGENVIVSCDRHGVLHAFANTCRHRGAMLCDPTDPNDLLTVRGAGSIQCPYHAWTYGLDGRLLSTPRVPAGEIDRDSHGLWPFRIDTWNGLVFVSLAAVGPSLGEWIDEHATGLLAFADIPIAGLELVERTVSEVAANWKIIIENYKECLHCPIVHPELVDLIPVYQSGDVIDHARDDGAVELSGDGNSFTETGGSELPVLPGIDGEAENLYRGATGFPNMFIDVTGTGLILSTLLPMGADRTVVVGEYLFAPSIGDADEHDPEQVVAFSELVAAQDYAVCERVQKGVASPAFTGGTLTEKDAGIAEFNRHYLEVRGALNTIADAVYDSRLP
jgi:Rieske 2Fe-2S family protein